MEYTEEEKLIILFCGLPARGKSFLSRKLAKFLVWIGYDTKVFSIGQFRRELIKNEVDCKFFENENTHYFQLRENCVYRVIDDMIDYLDLSKGKIGIIDGTNTRKERRRMIEKYFKLKIFSSQNIKKYNFIWIESFIDSKNILLNIFKTKLRIDDYKDWDEEKALDDYNKRIEIFEKVYWQISDENDPCVSYIKFKNRGVEIETRNLSGYLPSTILSFLVNLEFCDKPIFMSRHGESQFNELKKIGGDSSICERGKVYAKKLKDFMLNYLSKGKHIIFKFIFSILLSYFIINKIIHEI